MMAIRYSMKNITGMPRRFVNVSGSKDNGITAKELKPQALTDTIQKVKSERNMVPPTTGKFILARWFNRR